MAAYMEMTQGTPTSTRKFTYSGWIKRCHKNASADEETIFSIGASGDSYYNGYRFKSTQKLHINFDSTASGSTCELVTTAVYKDPAAWYHIVLACDTEQVSSGDRLRLYVNGEEVTEFDTEVQPALDRDLGFLASGDKIVLGRQASGSSQYFNGNMSWVQYVDGLQLAPTEFGETDSTSGIWKIKPSPSATPGNNGFCLKMEDRTNLDLDSSSNAHTFTTGGTALPTYDNPSNNFSTMNPLNDPNSDCDYEVGNTRVTNSGQWRGFTSSLGMGGGKWYTEFKITGTNAHQGIAFGIGKAGVSTSTKNMESGNNGYASKYAYGYERWAMNANKTNNNSSTGGYGTIMAENDIGMIAFDAENGTIWTGVNGTWDNSATSGEIAAGTTTNAMFSSIVVDDPFFFTCSIEGTSVSPYVNWNFGNGYFGTTAISSAGTVSTGDDSQFEYDVPTGYYGLNTKNLGSYS